ncbi:MAG: HAD family hydrolase [Candidatus Izemoplasmatales bacterium]
MKKIKAVIFDLDGTLLNTIEDIASSANQALELLHLQSYSTDLYKVMVGDGVKQLIERLLFRQNASIDLYPELEKNYLEIYAKNASNKTAPYPGINDLLCFLNENKISSAVLSNKPHKDTVNVIDYYFRDHPFTKVYGKMEGYLPKPDPKKLNELVSELGVQKEEILYVGDTSTDMQTAQNSGLTKVACLWGFRNFEELQNESPDYIVSEPKEIIEIIKKVNQ